MPTLAVLALALGVVSPDPPRLSYHLTYAAPEWRVTLHATNLPRRGIALELNDFGSWTSLADYYITRITSDPPSVPDPSNPARWILQPPADWDGFIRAEYVLHAAAEGTAVQQRHALLPVRTGTYTYGCTLNTLMSVLVDGAQFEAARTVTITPPDGWRVFSGWGGGSDGEQTFEIGRGERNGLIVMGEFTGRADVVAGEIPIEVRQFGAGPVCAEKIAEWIAKLAPLMRDTTGVHPGPIRVFITDSAGGGMMTDRGLMIGVRADWTPADTDLPSTRHTVAHELYHAWLGGMLTPPADMVWFLEGFTDYLSLWHAAAAGVVSPEWFVRRLTEFADRAGQSSLGTISFIDPGVNWRDDDGPNETMAYAGAHVVALALDAELRRRGHERGVRALIADLLAAPGRSCTRDDVHAWFKANDAEDLWMTYIAGRAVPDVRATLVSLGCEPGFEPVPLAYLGVRAEPSDPAQPLRALRIVELDPDGPAALAGARVGDVITGWFPARSDPVEVGPEVTTPFTFGMTAMEPGNPGTYFGVRRDGAEIRIECRPRTISGGRRPWLEPTPRFHEFLKP